MRTQILKNIFNIHQYSLLQLWSSSTGELVCFTRGSSFRGARAVRCSNIYNIIAHKPELHSPHVY